MSPLTHNCLYSLEKIPVSKTTRTNSFNSYLYNVQHKPIPLVEILVSFEKFHC